jgi:hypothetical protein
LYNPTAKIVFGSAAAGVPVDYTSFISWNIVVSTSSAITFDANITNLSSGSPTSGSGAVALVE